MWIGGPAVGTDADEAPLRPARLDQILLALESHRFGYLTALVFFGLHLS
jgi:hypothetical protein